MIADSVLEQALSIAREVGDVQMCYFRKETEVRWKETADPVTAVDEACERLIARRIQEAFPTHAMIGEEGEGFGDSGAEYVWFCDPLDGTVNYTHGVPIFCVSLALYRSGEPEVGVVHAAALGETYWAVRGHGAFRNGDRLRVSEREDPLESVLGSGFSTRARLSGENLREWKAILRNFQAVRRTGSAALDLCWVAAGSYEGFWEYGLKPWDVAAGCLLVTEAGGVLSDISGQPHEILSPTLVAASSRMHGRIVEELMDATKHESRCCG